MTGAFPLSATGPIAWSASHPAAHVRLHVGVEVSAPHPQRVAGPNYQQGTGLDELVGQRASDVELYPHFLDGEQPARRAGP